MLKNRFLSVFVLAFAAGIAMPFLLGTGMEAVAFLICFCVSLPAVGAPLAVFLLRKKGKTVLLYLTFACVGLCLGSGWLWIRSLPYREYAAFQGREDVLEGTVTESGSSMESSYLELEVERSHIGLPQGTRIRLYGASSGDIRMGDYVRAECDYGKVSKPSFRATSVALTGNGRVVSYTRGDSPLSSLRNTLLDACEDLYTPYRSAGLAQALILRESSRLPYETTDGYRNAGVSHLLSISGLHLAILVALLRRCLLAFRLRKVPRECLALVLILLYCFMTGFSPAIVRSAVMLGFLLVGELLLSEIDSITVLFIALLVLLVANPYSLLSVGLQLSFLSCLGIMLLEPYVSDLQKRIRGDAKARYRLLRRFAASITGSVLISCGAVVFTFPVTTLTFGDLSYLAPVSNLIFVPLFTPILAFVLLSVLLYPLLPFLGYALAFLPGVVLRGMDLLFSWLLSADIGSVTMVGGWVIVPVVLSALAIISMMVLPKRSIPVFLSCTAGALVSAVILAWAVPSGTPSVLKASAAEGYVFLTDGETSVFVDVGELSVSHPVELPPALSAYLVTEADKEALARLRSVLQITEISALYLPVAGSSGQGNDLSAYLKLADLHGCAVYQYRYAVETELLCFYVKEGRIDTTQGISVLLPGGTPLQEYGEYVLLPDKTGAVPPFENATFYLSSDFEGKHPSMENVRYYIDSITFKNGEVTAP